MYNGLRFCCLVYVFICLAVCLPICLPIVLSVCLSACRCVTLAVRQGMRILHPTHVDCIIGASTLHHRLKMYVHDAVHGIT